MSVAETREFFKQKRTVAEVKSELLKAYLPAWCAQYLTPSTSPAETILYVDLLAGPVFNEENNLTGSGLVLEQIYQSRNTETDLNAAVQTFFYDASKAITEKLATDFAQLPFPEPLGHLPVVLKDSEQQLYLADLLNKPIPAILITNPFSNLIASELLNPALLNSRTDLFFLFSPNRMRSALAPGQDVTGLSVLFGAQLPQLQENWQKASSARKKEQAIVNALENGLREKQYYTLIFKINLPDKDVASHYLLYAARTRQSYFLMKELIAQYNDYQEDGVPLFSVNQKSQLPLLPGFFQYMSKDTLQNLIEIVSNNRRHFHYRTIRDIYEEHAPGTHFILANYLQAFDELRQQGHVNLVNEKNKQVKTISDTAIVFYKLHRGK